MSAPHGTDDSDTSQGSSAAIPTPPPPAPSLSTSLPASDWLPMQVPVGPATGRARMRPPTSIVTSPIELGSPVPYSLLGIQDCGSDRFQPGAQPTPPGLGLLYYDRAINGGYGTSDLDGRRQIFIMYGAMYGEAKP